MGKRKGCELYLCDDCANIVSKYNSVKRFTKLHMNPCQYCTKETYVFLCTISELKK